MSETEEIYRRIGTPRRGGIIAVCDHASNFVPGDIPLGVPPEALDKHIAWDIGAAGVCERLARRHDIAAHLACVSRLVIDLHREEDSPALVPESSDGILIPGNIGADREMRIKRFYRPYHDAFDRLIEEVQPELILSIHSFTPELESAPAERPWEVALLYNQDDRAARHAIRMFKAQRCVVGDNQPYSGKQLNATMNRHAEARGIPYCAIELRNDLIANEAGQARWASMIGDIAGRVALALEAT